MRFRKGDKVRLKSVLTDYSVAPGTVGTVVDATLYKYGNTSYVYLDITHKNGKTRLAPWGVFVDDLELAEPLSPFEQRVQDYCDAELAR